MSSHPPPPPPLHPLSLSCRFLLTLFVSLVFPFFPPYGSTEEEIARLFDSRIDTQMRGSEQRKRRERHPSRMNFLSTVIEMPFSACEVNRTRIFRDIPATDCISLACRFKLAVKIDVDFNILKGTEPYVAPDAFHAFKFKMICL